MSKWSIHRAVSTLTPRVGTIAGPRCIPLPALATLHRRSSTCHCRRVALSSAGSSRTTEVSLRARRRFRPAHSLCKPRLDLTPRADRRPDDRWPPTGHRCTQPHSRLQCRRDRTLRTFSQNTRRQCSCGVWRSERSIHSAGTCRRRSRCRSRSRSESRPCRLAQVVVAALADLPPPLSQEN